MRRFALLVVLLSVCGAAPRADASPFPPAVVAAGPVWAGDRIAWVEAHGRGRAVVVGDPASGIRKVVDRWTSVVPDPYLAMAASGDVLAVHRAESHCPISDCREPLVSTLVSELRAGPLDGPLATGPPCAGPPVAAGPLLALHCPREAAFYGRVVIREGGAEREVRIDGRVFALEGPLLAYRTGPETPGEGTGVRVVEHASGREVRHIPLAAGTELAVAGDGSLAYTEHLGFPPQGGGVVERVVSAPAGADPRVLPLPPGDLRIAGGRIAVHTAGAQDRSRDLIVADATSGTPLAVTRRWSGAYDFDGRRLLWGERPCALTTIQVWEIGTPPPPTQSRACGRPRVEPPARWPPPGSRLRLPVRCPAPRTSEMRHSVAHAGRSASGDRPAGGCAGQVIVGVSGSARGSGRRVALLGRGAFTVAAGRRGYADVEIHQSDRGGGDGLSRRHLRVQVFRSDRRTAEVQRVPLQRRGAP